MLAPLLRALRHLLLRLTSPVDGRASTTGKLLLFLGSTAATLLLVEAGIRALDLFEPARRASEQIVSSGRHHSVETGAAAPDPPANSWVLHPFQGWARAELVHRWNQLFELKKSHFVIVIFGGSVAGMVCNQAQVAIVPHLERKRPELRGRIHVVGFAHGGYKQPQQLFSASQLLLLGAPIDVLVNIDGFNEAALGGSDAHQGNHPLFPHRSHLLKVSEITAEAPSPSTLLLAARLIELQRRTARIEEQLRRFPVLRRWELAKSILGRILLQTKEEAARNETELDKIALERLDSRWIDFPHRCAGRESTCSELIGEIWQNASIMMASLAKEAGVHYLHALQPNQYVPDSKTLTPKELKDAYKPDHSWSRAATANYPVLRRRGAELQRRGIEFHDLTMLFRERSETIYADTCCHYNQVGNRVLGETIAELLHQSLPR